MKGFELRQDMPRVFALAIVLIVVFAGGGRRWRFAAAVVAEADDLQRVAGIGRNFEALSAGRRSRGTARAAEAQRLQTLLRQLRHLGGSHFFSQNVYVQ